VWQSERETISGNSCQDNGVGIWCSGDDHWIVNNSCTGNRVHGISLESSTGYVLSGNRMTGKGLRMNGYLPEHWNSHTVDLFNTIDGKTIHYYKFVSGITVPTEAGQLILANCSQVTVKGLDCRNSFFGIGVLYSSKVSVENNVCSGNDYGIYARYSDNVTLKGNNCSLNLGEENSHGYGIKLEFVETREISGNVLDFNSGEGLHSHLGEHPLFTNNTCSFNDGDGLYLNVPSSAGATTVEDNILSGNGGNGLFVYGDLDMVSGNTCTLNGKSGLLLRATDHATITDNILEGNQGEGGLFEGTGPGEVRDNSFCHNGGTGAKFDGSGSMNLTGNNFSDNTGAGIHLWDTNGCNLTSNTISGNQWNGITIGATADSNTVFRNHITGNDIGIIIGTYSDDNRLSENVISGNEGGIKLSLASSCHLIRNVLDNNGIHLSGADYNIIEGNSITGAWNGILMETSDNNTITSNIISDGYQGLHLASSSSNTFTMNEIRDNAIGIGVGKLGSNDASRDNHFHENGIYGNGGHGVWAMGNDEVEVNATNNWWGHPSGPNHSSGNPDGKGDIVSDFVHFHPWKNLPNRYLPPEAVILLVPDSAREGETISFSGEGTGYGDIRYIWSSSIDGVVYNGTEPVFSCDNLSAGTHTISLKVMDEIDNLSAADTASLTIDPDDEPPVLVVVSFQDRSSSGGNVTIQGTASDNVGVLRVEYNVSGTPGWHLANGTMNWSLELNLTGLEDGEHTIRLRAFDGKHYSTEKELTVKTGTDNKEDDGDGGFLLGFELVCFLVVLTGLAVMARRPKEPKVPRKKSRC